MANIDTSKKLPVTRFDVRETEDGPVLRLFSKRVKVAEIDEGDARDDYADILPTFIELDRTAAQVLDFLGEEPGSEDEDEDEGGRGSIVPEKYRVRYGATQRCGDEVAETFSAYVTLPRAGRKQDIDGGLDRTKLREVADANGLGTKLDDYEERGLNGGLLRMNISNILRGMIRRGQRVIIGDKTWTEDKTNPKHPEAKAAAKLARDKAAVKAEQKAPKPARKPRAAKAK